MEVPEHEKDALDYVPSLLYAPYYTWQNTKKTHSAVRVRYFAYQTHGAKCGQNHQHPRIIPQDLFIYIMGF